MRFFSIYLHSNLLLCFLTLSSGAWGGQKLSPQGDFCTPLISHSELTRSRLVSRLRHPDLKPAQAIQMILNYLKHKKGWRGLQKHEEWQALIHTYNRKRHEHWINSPFLVTKDQHYVEWGETRGHILIFTKGGQIFISFNPERSDPQNGELGYQIDWNDPTLKPVK